MNGFVFQNEYSNLNPFSCYSGRVEKYMNGCSRVFVSLRASLSLNNGKYNCIMLMSDVLSI